MKKTKKDASINPETQFEDFNTEDFSDIETFAEDETPSSDTTSDDLNPEFHGADPDLPNQSEPSSSRGILQILKENWLYATIGIVVIVVAIYLIMNLFSTPAPQPATPQAQTSAGFNSVPATTDASAPATPPAAAAATSPVTTTPQPVQQAPVNVPTVKNTSNQTANLSNAQMQKLIQSVSRQNNQQALSDANAKLNSMQASMNSLTQNVVLLTQTLNNVETKLSSTQSQLGSLLAQQTASANNLTLRAVVPGRAWLVDAKGNTTSVTEGASLGSFGTVTDIDPSSNSVTTSSGYVFK